MKEALKLALEALNWSTPHDGAVITHGEAITNIKAALAQPEQDNTYVYASKLAKTMWQKHYMKESPKFELLDTTEGVLTQIDNMTCGLVREKPAQPAQEAKSVTYEEVANAMNSLMRGDTTQVQVALEMGNKKLYTTPPQRTWVDLTPQDLNDIFKISHTGEGAVYLALKIIKEKNNG